MKKNWKKPNLVIFDDRLITSGGTKNQWEKAYYCDGSVKKTLLPPAAGVGSYCIPPVGAGGNAYPDCVSAGNDGVKGVDWFNLRIIGGNGPIATPMVGTACS